MSECEHSSLRVKSQLTYNVTLTCAASTLRQPQHIALVDAAREDVGKKRYFERCWYSWKLVVAPHSFASFARMRVPNDARRMKIREVVDRAFRRGQHGVENHADLAPLFSADGSFTYAKPTALHCLRMEYVHSVAIVGCLYSLPADDEFAWELAVVGCTPHVPMESSPAHARIEEVRRGRCVFQIVNKNPAGARAVLANDGRPILRDSVMI